MPIAAFQGSAALARPRAACASRFGRRKHPQLRHLHGPERHRDRGRRRQRPVRGRARGHGRLRRPLQGLRPHGGARPRRQAPLALRAPRRTRACSSGQKVAAGDVLGTVGASALEGPGLYFEMRFQGRPEDPLEWLRRPERRRSTVGRHRGRPGVVRPSAAIIRELHELRAAASLVALVSTALIGYVALGSAPRPRPRRHELRPARGLQRGRAPRARRLRRAREPRPGDGGSPPRPDRRARRRQRLPRRRGVPACTSSPRRTPTRRSASCSPGASRSSWSSPPRARLARGEGGAAARGHPEDHRRAPHAAARRLHRPAAAARRPRLARQARGPARGQPTLRGLGGPRAAQPGGRPGARCSRTGPAT